MFLYLIIYPVNTCPENIYNLTPVSEEYYLIFQTHCINDQPCSFQCSVLCENDILLQ